MTALGHIPRDHRLTGGVLLVAAVATAVALTGVRGHAAGVPVSSTTMATFRPTQLPPTCTRTTVVAEADTWVSGGSQNTNYGADATLSVNPRGNAKARALLRFALPTVPTGCTLASATLRVHNAVATSGRSISVFAAGTAWDESTVTWKTGNPTMTGTAVTAPVSSGWMQWTVTTHVANQYAGANHGFVLQDSVEGGNTDFTQQLDSRDRPNQPTLVLRWQ